MISNIKRGHKIKLIKEMGVFKNVGEICDVIDVTPEVISFRFGKFNMGCISHDEFCKYFMKYQKKPEIKPVDMREIERTIQRADMNVERAFDRTTVVTLKLPNGFQITESSSCIDANSYDENLAIEICKCSLAKRLAEMEAYHKMQSAYEMSV